MLPGMRIVESLAAAGLALSLLLGLAVPLCTAATPTSTPEACPVRAVDCGRDDPASAMACCARPDEGQPLPPGKPWAPPALAATDVPPSAVTLPPPLSLAAISPSASAHSPPNRHLFTLHASLLL